ncbi:MAG: hypothetical protein QW384_05990 [Archaeoglobaceae archaeon]
MRTEIYLESMSLQQRYFHLKAIQFESGILAYEGWFSKTLEIGKTEIVEFNFTVPNYNYLLNMAILVLSIYALTTEKITFKSF